MSAAGAQTRGRLVPGWRRWALLGLMLVAAARAAEPVPVMVRTAPGRFEIAAHDSGAAHTLAALAEETWRALEAPLSLPAGFSTPVFVRLANDVEARGAEAFRANLEPGGVVSVWIHGPAVAGARETQRSALVRGLLLRLAVALHGANANASVPRWLELAAEGWCATRSNPAALDALKQASRQFEPLGLSELLGNPPTSGAEAGRVMANAVWLMTLLQMESGRVGAWTVFLRAVLGGERGEAALDAAFRGRFASPAQRDLWWMTGWHYLRRARSLPVMEPAESRAELEQAGRFVFAPEEVDVVVPLRRVLAHADDAIVAAELKRRAAEVGRLVLALHPFYRNAGLSLVAALEAGKLEAAKREEAVAQFEADWRDAIELEVASRLALDALEREGGKRP